MPGPGLDLVGEEQLAELAERFVAAYGEVLG